MGYTLLAFCSFTSPNSKVPTALSLSLNSTPKEPSLSKYLKKPISLQNPESKKIGKTRCKNPNLLQHDILHDLLHSPQYDLLHSLADAASIPRRNKSFGMKLRCRGSSAGELIIPDGHVPVYVDDEMERFVVSAELLNHPVFVGLLDKSEQGNDYYISLMDTVFSDDVGPTALAAARGGCPGTFRGCGKGYGGTSASSRMAYSPTHKQHSKESESTLLTSEP